MTKRMWQAVRAFLAAEEVPRWFGLSIVLIYLMGLGAIAHSGMNAMRREALARIAQSDRVALDTLVEQLSCIAALIPEEQQVAKWNEALTPWRSAIGALQVRVLDSTRQVVASTESSEIGKPASTLSLAESNATRVLRKAVPIPNGNAYTIESTLPLALKDVSLLAASGDSAVVILVGLGAMFMVYRCLRGQMKSVSQITSRLQARAAHLSEDLGSLRLAAESDELSKAWNQLIELTQSLSEAVQRSTANEELSKALNKTGGGALAEALNAIPDGIICITDEVRFEYLNSTANQLLGWSMSDAKKSNLAEAHSTGIGALVLAAIRKALQPSGNYESRMETLEGAADPTGDVSTYRVWVSPLQRANRSGECIVIIRDVSQQMRGERAREDFVTQVTHELRTPLTNIRAYAETLSSGMFDDPKVITECYNVITKETRRLSRLIEDILSVSQLEVGSIELHVDSVDLKTLLTEGVRDVRQLADEKNIDLQVVLPPKRELIQADRDKLAVVINNLLGNAIKYTPKGGNVVAACQFTPDAAIVSVKDNGIGIDPVDHARVFEKFQRANDPAVQSESGTGIGLYTAREIVRRHGGEIELISAKGAGSTFMVRIPHKESRAAALNASEESK